MSDRIERDEDIQQCPNCKNETFWIVEGHEYYDYVYFICTQCKNKWGVSTSNYGDTTTDLESKGTASD